MLSRSRTFVAIALTLTAITPMLVTAAPASAFPKGDSVIGFDYTVIATTHIKKSDITMSPPPGKFHGLVDLDLGKLTGSIQIPPTTFTQYEAGVGLITATAAIVSTKPVTGTVKLANFFITATSTFNIKMKSMYLTPISNLPIPIPLPLPKINLVGNNCVTSSPISVTMKGIAHIGEKSTFSGLFTIPPFKNCQGAENLLNQEVPGPGNTFTATALP